jgi:hypothetical protein
MPGMHEHRNQSATGDRCATFALLSRLLRVRRRSPLSAGVRVFYAGQKDWSRRTPAPGRSDWNENADFAMVDARS